MKILILGATGYIGRRLHRSLLETDWATPVGASRSPSRPEASGSMLCLDSRDVASLSKALQGVDCVVNCVAGDYRSISHGSAALSESAAASGCKRIVHLSSMAVYGRQEGLLDEHAALDTQLGWYARAKCNAEHSMASFAARGGVVVVLRPGCVFGAGSQLWVGRIANWLRAGRIGDLGAAGDGWSNLVHVNDVCEAIIAAIRMPLAIGELPAFNLAAPDSPRWNRYFTDLALALSLTPVKRISRRRLSLDSRIAGPPLKIAEMLMSRLRLSHDWLPPPLPPSVTRLWARHVRLDCHAATARLGFTWTSYPSALEECVAWLRAN